MSVLEYLPGVPQEFWKAYEVFKGNIVIPAQSEIPLQPSPILNERGLFVNLTVASNNENLTFKILFDDRKITGSFKSLYNYGFTSYIPDAPFIVSYNTTTNLYVAYMHTSQPYPFYRNFSVSAQNTTNSAMTIDVVEINAFILKHGFYKALADLKAGKLA